MVGSARVDLQRTLPDGHLASGVLRRRRQVAVAREPQRQRLRGRAARLRPVPRQPRSGVAARRALGRARAAPRALRPPDRLLVRLAAARHGRRRHRHQGQAGRGRHAQRRRSRGRRGHGRHRGGGLDRERRRGPPRRPLPRPAERGRHRVAGGVAGRPPFRAPRLGPHARHGEHGRHHRRGLRRRTPRAGPRRDGQPGGEPHRPDALGQDRRRRRPPRRRAQGRRRRGPQGAALPRGRDRPRDRRRVQPRGRPAVAGPVVDCVVTCPLHESQFDVRDGHIVRGPAHHPQPALPSRVRNGFVEVRGSQPGRRRAKT